MVAHAYHPSLQETGQQISVSSRPPLSTYQVPGQSGLCLKTLLMSPILIHLYKPNKICVPLLTFLKSTNEQLEKRLVVQMPKDNLSL